MLRSWKGPRLVCSTQNTAKWLEMRRQYKLTASEIGQAIGVSPYGSIKKLWEIKTGRSSSVISPYLQRIFDYGHDNEPNALQQIRRYLAPYALVETTGLWDLGPLGASPDGLVYDIGKSDPCAIVEIKCPWTQTVYDELSQDRDHPIIPVNHYVQMLVQMRALCVDHGWYVCWTPTHTVIMRIPYSGVAWTMIECQVQKFIDSLDLYRPPMKNPSLGLALECCMLSHPVHRVSLTNPSTNDHDVSSDPDFEDNSLV